MKELLDLGKGKIFDEASKEFRVNGIYVINDVTYMSLWAFNRKSKEANKAHCNKTTGRKLAMMQAPYIVTHPSNLSFPVRCYNCLLLGSVIEP